MSNPWKKVTEPTVQQNISEIIREEFARRRRFEVQDENIADQLYHQFIGSSVDKSIESLQENQSSTNCKNVCDSDGTIAQLLQDELNREYDDQLKRLEIRNGDAKISVSYVNYFNKTRDSEDEDLNQFECNKKEFVDCSKSCYFKVDGELVTIQDRVINDWRHACHVMDRYPPEFYTTDYTEYGIHSKSNNSELDHHLRKENKVYKRKHESFMLELLKGKETYLTVVLGLDQATRKVMLRLIENGILEDFNKVISSGQKAVIIHASLGSSDSTECAIKVCTIKRFRPYVKYIKEDNRFKERFLPTLNLSQRINLWVEKERDNVLRLKKIGLNCPVLVCSRKHVLVMSFVGDNGKAAPKLSDVMLKPETWQSVYNEVEEAMYKIFNEGHLIHTNLSPYNIVWWNSKCWFMDWAQAVFPEHPKSLKYLFGDCFNIVNFFEKKGVAEVRSAENLFKYITGFNDFDVTNKKNLKDACVKYNAQLSHYEVILEDEKKKVYYPSKNCQIKLDDINKDDGKDIINYMSCRSPTDKDGTEQKVAISNSDAKSNTVKLKKP